jgi:hypothetical protein
LNTALEGHGFGLRTLRPLPPTGTIRTGSLRLAMNGAIALIRWITSGRDIQASS